MSVPCTNLKGPHTAVSDVVRGSTFTCFGNVALACHDDCPSLAFQCKTVTLIFFPLKAADGTVSPASLHDDLIVLGLRGKVLVVGGLQGWLL